jgi:hypothetical protein
MHGQDRRIVGTRIVVGLVVVGWFAGASMANAGEGRAEPDAVTMQAAGKGIAPGGGEVLYDTSADVAISVVPAEDGAVALTAAGAGLRFTKRAYRGGQYEMVFEHRGDYVAVSAGWGAMRVSRRRGAAALEAGRAAEDDYRSVRALLADSSAVRQFRTMVANLDEATLETPAGVGLLLADAEIGFLDGDVGALSRLARAFRDRASQSQPSSEPTASGANRSGGDAQPAHVSCYMKWQQEVVAAWIDYEQCLDSFSGWNPVRNLCGLAWDMRATSAWFEFLGCIAFPWRG